MAQLETFRLHPGDPAPPFELPGVDDRTHSLKEFASAPLLCVVFSCNHCPYAQAWEGRLMDLQREYGPKGLQMVLINSNDAKQYPDDRFDKMRERAQRRGYPFPYLWDESQDVARAYGALVTPHPMLFDRSRRLLFQGRVDDNHERPDRVREHYLRDAVEAALSNRPIAHAELPVVGCSVKWKP